MKRKFVAIAPIRVQEPGGTYFIGAMAVADDGTGWQLLPDRAAPQGWRWIKLVELPDSEAVA